LGWKDLATAEAAAAAAPSLPEIDAAEADPREADKAAAAAAAVNGVGLLQQQMQQQGAAGGTIRTGMDTHMGGIRGMIRMRGMDIIVAAAGTAGPRPAGGGATGATGTIPRRGPTTIRRRGDE
jgi:hypothetical protein